jgi:hypothetical protein
MEQRPSDWAYYLAGRELRWFDGLETMSLMEDVARIAVGLVQKLPWRVATWTKHIGISALVAKRKKPVEQRIAANAMSRVMHQAR